MLTEEPTRFDTLSDRLAGRLALPGAADWDAARQAFNLTVDQQPAAVVFPSDVDEVVAVVRFAREAGLRIAPQRTGHNASPLVGSLEDTVIVNTSRMTGVEIDAGNRRARVRAGAKWEELVGPASELGLAALHGSSLDVSIVGYSLGGGMGWYARKHGLSANSVTAIEVVTPNGELVRADHDHDPDLFWALRGGGGNFGVVTAMEIDLFPIAEVYAGALFFPFERAAEVLHAWHEWTATVPDEVTSVGRLLQFPPIPDIPEPMRGNAFAVVEAAYLGGEADGADLLAPLRELGPVMDTFAMVPPLALGTLHMDPEDPVPYLSGHELVGELPATALDDLLAVAGPGSGSPLLSVELRHLGGALARPEPASGALASLEGSFCMFAVGMVVDGPSGEATATQIARVTEALAPYKAGRYMNFVEESMDTAQMFSPDTYRRLEDIKGRYDPGNVVRANHPIEPPAGA